MPVARDRKSAPLRTALLERGKGLLVPPVRAWVRYAPFHKSKQQLWARWVNPHLQWHPHQFEARTVFGSRLAGNTEELLQQYVYYFGVWEPNLTAWIRDRLQPGDTFIDVGANIGYYSLLASTRVGEKGSVVAVEPSPPAFRALEENLARNRAGNVRAVNVAAFDCWKMLTIFDGPRNHTGLASVFPAPDLRAAYQVRGVPLSEILRPGEAERARLIKIDVEGAEGQVVDGMVPLLDVGPEDLEVIVEIGPRRLRKQGRRAEEILGLFSARGFHAYRIENDYSWPAYVPPRRVSRAGRIDGPLTSETDVIFSRIDAPGL